MDPQKLSKDALLDAKMRIQLWSLNFQYGRKSSEMDLE